MSSPQTSADTLDLEAIRERARLIEPGKSLTRFAPFYEVSYPDFDALVQEVERLTEIEQAARKLDDNWDAVNRCYTLGHPYAQELRRALAPQPKGAQS